MQKQYFLQISLISSVFYFRNKNIQDLVVLVLNDKLESIHSIVLSCTLTNRKVLWGKIFKLFDPCPLFTSGNKETHWVWLSFLLVILLVFISSLSTYINSDHMITNHVCNKLHMGACAILFFFSCFKWRSESVRDTICLYFNVNI